MDIFVLAGVGLVLLVAVFVSREWRRPRLFVTNFDDFFPEKPDGRVAEKCLKLGWRCLYLMKKGDAIIVARPVPPAFLRSVETVLGFKPLIYHLTLPVSTPLNFVSEIMRDADLMGHLRADGRRWRYVIQPLINTPNMYDLGRELGFPVVGTSEDLVRKGLIRDLNSKIIFAQWCEREGLQTAGLPCYSLHAVEAEAMRILRAGRTAVIREDVSAGGLGNGCFSSAEELQVLLRRMQVAGTRFMAMVGPLLHNKVHVSVMFEVGKYRNRIITTCLRRIRDYIESVGGVSPCPDIPGLAEAIEITHCYARHLRKLGYRGIADIDFAFDHNGSNMVLFESNARLILTSVPQNLLDRFRRLWSVDTTVVEYDEDPPRGDTPADLDVLLHQARTLPARVASDIGRNVAAVIVAPPDEEKGWYSIATIVEGHTAASRAREVFRSMLKHALVRSRLKGAAGREG